MRHSSEPYQWLGRLVVSPLFVSRLKTQLTNSYGCAPKSKQISHLVANWCQASVLLLGQSLQTRQTRLSSTRIWLATITRTGTKPFNRLQLVAGDALVSCFWLGVGAARQRSFVSLRFHPLPLGRPIPAANSIGSIQVLPIARASRRCCCA